MPYDTGGNDNGGRGRSCYNQRKCFWKGSSRRRRMGAGIRELGRNAQMNKVRKRLICHWLLFLWIGAIYLTEWWWGNELIKRFKLDLWALFTIFAALHLSLCWISLTPKL